METPRTDTIDTHHVDVLDGLRVVAVSIVCWYHIWQQSWLAPVVTGPAAKLFGTDLLSFDVIPRTGYIFVDFMLLLSAFLLFLPHARAMELGEPVPKALPFYKKRLVRIVPSYYFAVLVIFFAYALPSGAFLNARDAAFEVAADLTFTQMLFRGPYLMSRINGVLWTVCVEMLFYLLFPLFAAAFRRKPLLTYAAMVGASSLFIRVLVLPRPELVRMMVNQFPAFLGVFANGMLFALLFVKLSKSVRRTPLLALAGTGLMFVSGYLILRILYGAAGSEHLQMYQMDCRYVFSLALSVFLISATVSARWVRFLLSNRLMRFLSGISYNLYIWHQWLAVRLKEWRIPYWEGDTAPNFLGDVIWQRRYTLLCFVGALLLAVAATYLIEKPCAKLLTLKRIRKSEGLQ